MRDDEKRVNRYRELAQREIAAGAKADEVERLLVQEGAHSNTAASIVNECYAARLSETESSSNERSVNWTRVVAGVLLTLIAFTFVYFVLSAAVEDLGVDTRWPWRVRLTLAGGGIAATFGLNLMLNGFGWRRAGKR